MTVISKTVGFLNSKILRRVGAQLTSLTLETQERDRLQKLVDRGHFNKAVYPVPQCFIECDPDTLLEEVDRRSPELRRLFDSDSAPAGFNANNVYFSSPDVEILYVMIGLFRPTTFVEVGSGYSTLVARRAILDYATNTRIFSIDPAPRSDVKSAVDYQFLSRLEDTDLSSVADLQARDVLFIDSSHEVRVGNDVTTLFLEVLSRLPAGVIVHVHDIFLPYEYPEAWVVHRRWPWNEQQLVQAVLFYSEQFDVLWPGHYLQRTLRDFPSHFPQCGDRSAQSLWFRKR